MSIAQYQCLKFDILIISDFGQNEYQRFKPRVKTWACKAEQHGGYWAYLYWQF